MISFIYFDLGKVLLDFSHARSCERMAETAGVSPELVREVVFDTQLAHAYERGDVTSHEFYECFCEATQTRPEFQKLYYACADMFSPIAGMDELVARLHAGPRRLGILSNTCEAHWNYCLVAYPMLSARFAIHALSFQLRALKPEAKIYRAAAELAGVDPAQIFFTDDRPENVSGALAAGFDAVQFESRAQLVGALSERGLYQDH